MPSFPSQTEIFQPLLAAYQDAGGRAENHEIYERLADHFDLPQGAREARTPAKRDGKQTVNSWARHVRWVQQRAKLEGLLQTPESGVWQLTGEGDRLLRNARPGVVVTVYTTELGVMLWADAQTAAGVVDDESVDLIFTSLPYPLIKRKGYQNEHPVREHLDWAVALIEDWIPKLAGSGTLALNVGDVYLKGLPAQSGWTERLLVRLLDLGLYKAGPALYWRNPSKMPAPAEWVTIRRQRIKDEVEPVWLLSKNPIESRMSNTRVLKPYSEAMLRTLAHGGEAAQSRPSGHARADGAFATDNGGSIPGNVLDIANTDSNGRYLRRCREENVQAHPARFPSELARFVLEYTTEPGDLMVELCAGSGTACREAEILQRRWLGMDLSLTYLHGSAFRFEDVPTFQPQFPQLIQTTLRRRDPDLFAAA